MFHPLMRVWIEIASNLKSYAFDMFHPLMRVWIEIINYLYEAGYLHVSPSYEGVD